MAAETAPTEPSIYRLTDIETEEVSIVDRAANQRKFIVVKGANMANGTKVVPDGKGGHTVVKDAPPTAPAATPPAPPAAPAATPAPGDATASGMPSQEPQLRLSPEAKTELTKRLEAAVARISALKALIDGASEVAGLVEVPAEISTMVAELLTGIAQGESTEKSETVTKGLPQFSTARTAQLQAAYDALGAVLGGVTKPIDPPAAPAPEATPGAETATETEVGKAMAKALAGFESKIAEGFSKLTTVIGKQGEAIAKQASRVEEVASGRPVPQSASPEGRANVDKGDDGEDDPEGVGGWPTDMSDPEKHDVTKVAPELRFVAPKRR